MTRVIVRDPTRSEEDFVALARHLGLQGVSYFVRLERLARHSSGWGEQGNRARRSRSGLRSLAADVLAFGDGRNDIEMLRWAGRGVAIGDAPDEVKAPQTT